MRSCSGRSGPKLVETIAWAAANGDRSENGDYIYGRKRLREIDRRLVASLASHEGGEGRRPMPPKARATRSASARRSNLPTRTTIAPQPDHRRRRRGRCQRGRDRLERAARPRADRRAGRRRAHRAPSRGREELRSDRDPLPGLSDAGATSCGGSDGIALLQASAIASSAASAACCSSSPSIVRHGDQRVSVLALSSSSARR